MVPGNQNPMPPLCAFAVTPHPNMQFVPMRRFALRIRFLHSLCGVILLPKVAGFSAGVISTMEPEIER